GYGVPSVDPGTADQHHRYVPDVSLTAAGHDGHVIQHRGSLFIASGTSASAPAFAGIMAIVNQVTNQANGNPNPRLYALASQVPSSFHDITSGTNAVPCAVDSPNCVDAIMTGYSAGPGYDLTTGWGSIDAYVFAHAWTTSTAPPPPVTGPPSPPNPPAPNASLTASTYHVFPAFADGTVSDGSYFRSTLMISNPSSSGTNTCTLQLRGLTVPGFAQTPYQLQPNGFVIAPTPATQSLKRVMPHYSARQMLRLSSCILIIRRMEPNWPKQQCFLRRHPVRFRFWRIRGKGPRLGSESRTTRMLRTRIVSQWMMGAEPSQVRLLECLVRERPLPNT